MVIMADRQRSESGQFVERVTLEDVLGVFEQVRGPVITSSDVAEALDCTTEAARQKLTRLYDQGKVDKRKTGRTTVWWQTDSSTTSASTPTPEEPPQEPREPAERGAEIDAALERVDTPGTGQSREKREEALRTAYEYLKEHGEAQRKDFKELLGDDVGYASFSSWWNNYVKAKNALKQLPNVEAPAEGEHTWRYVSSGGIYDPTEEF